MSYSSEVLADTPILYWKLNETSGTSITDSSGNGKTGTIDYGTVNTDYKLNQPSLLDSEPTVGCFAFTYWNPAGSMTNACQENITNTANLGGRSRIVRAYDSALDFGGTGKSWSAEYWFKTPVYQVWGPCILGRRDTIAQWWVNFNSGNIQPRADASPAPGFWTGYVLATGFGMSSYEGSPLNPTGLPFSEGWGSWGLNSASALPIFLTDNQPHHVVVTYNATIGRLTTYIDGVMWGFIEMMNGANAPNIMTNGTDYFIVGSRSRYSGGAGQEGYIGYIGHVAIYNTALSQARIEAHYLAGKSKVAGLHAGWAFTAAPQASGLEGFAATDLAAVAYLAAGDHSEALTATDVALGEIAITATASDGITLSEATNPAMSFGPTISETFSATDTDSGIKQLVESLADGLVTTDTQAAGTVQIGIINDGATLYCGLQHGGETYAGYVLNADTNASSFYEGFDFNSLAKIGPDYFGAGPTGVFKLEGSTDAGEPIAAMLNVGNNDAMTAYKKSYDSVYLGLTASGKMIMKVVVDGTEHFYEATNSAPVMKEVRVTPGKGLQATFWTFELWNQDGCDFDIASVDFYPVVLTRRL